MNKRFALLLVFVLFLLVACDPESDGTPVGTLVHKSQVPTQTQVPTPTYQSPSGELVAGQTVYSFITDSFGAGWCDQTAKRADGIWDTNPSQKLAVLIDDGLGTVVVADSGNAWFWAQILYPSLKQLNREGVRVSYDVEYIIRDMVPSVRSSNEFVYIHYQPYWGSEYIRVDIYFDGKIQESNKYQVFNTCTENTYSQQVDSIPGAP